MLPPPLPFAVRRRLIPLVSRRTASCGVPGFLPVRLDSNFHWGQLDKSHMQRVAYTEHIKRNATTIGGRAGLASGPKSLLGGRHTGWGLVPVILTTRGNQETLVAITKGVVRGAGDWQPAPSPSALLRRRRERSTPNGS